MRNNYNFCLNYNEKTIDVSKKIIENAYAYFKGELAPFFSLIREEQYRVFCGGKEYTISPDGIIRRITKSFYTPSNSPQKSEYSILKRPWYDDGHFHIREEAKTYKQGEKLCKSWTPSEYKLLAKAFDCDNLSQLQKTLLAKRVGKKMLLFAGNLLGRSEESVKGKIKVIRSKGCIAQLKGETI